MSIDAPPKAPDRGQYLSDCAGYAQEQVLFHMRHRDHWLKYQLVVQAGLLALASGIEIGGLRSEASLPDLLSLTVVLSFVFAALYIVEDRLVAIFCGYIHSLSAHEAALSGADTPIPNAEVFLQKARHGTTFVWIRLAAQVGAFLVIPAGLAVYRFLSISHWRWTHTAELAVDATAWAATILLLGWAFRLHWRLVPIPPSREVAGNDDRETPG